MHLPELIAIAVGTALLVAAAGRALVARWLVRRALAAGLRDEDPAVRAAAVRAAAQDGVSRHARMLDALTARETELAVRHALAEAVSQHRWEPATGRPMVRLRMWAYAQQQASRLPGAAAAGGVMELGALRRPRHEAAAQDAQDAQDQAWPTR